MKRLANADSDILSYREPCGWGVLFALPFFVGLIGLAWYLVSTFGHILNDWPAWGMVIGGLAALYAVYTMISWAISWFGCIGATIDKARGAVTTKWGLFFPIPTGTHALKDFSSLLIDVIVVIHYRNGSEMYRDYTFVLYLLGNQRVRIGRSSDYAPVRAMAEDVGRFLGMPVIDGTSSEPKVLPTETLGLSLKEKSTRGAAREMPPPPPQLRSKFRLEGDRIVIEMPRLATPGCLVIWFLLLIALLSLLTYIFIDSHGNWAPVALFGAIGGFMLAVFYSAVAPEQTILEVDSQGLEITRRGLILSSRRRVLAERVRELRLESFSIVAITDQETVSIMTTMLPDPEREWIHAVLQQVLTS